MSTKKAAKKKKKKEETIMDKPRTPETSNEGATRPAAATPAAAAEKPRPKTQAEKLAEWRKKKGYAK